MHGLLDLKMPKDWKQRTRVFVSAAKPRCSQTPLISREVYDAERGRGPTGRGGKKKAFDINGPAGRH